MSAQTTKVLAPFLISSSADWLEVTDAAFIKETLAMELLFTQIPKHTENPGTKWTPSYSKKKKNPKKHQGKRQSFSVFFFFFTDQRYYIPTSFLARKTEPHEFTG